MTATLNNTMFTILDHQFDIDELRDIVMHGMESGVSGFTYYRDTVRAFDCHDDEIQDYLSDWCYDNNVGKSSFAWFAPDAEDITQLKNKLVWSFVELKAADILQEVDAE
jgi:hypothetical protein